MGVFSEMQAGVYDPYDYMLRKGIIKTFPLSVKQKDFLDEKDKEKIEKLKHYLKVKAIRKLNSEQQAIITFENTENYLVVFNKSGGSYHDFIGIKNEIGKVKSYEGKEDVYIGTASYASKKNHYDENRKKLPRRTQSNILDIVQLTQDLDFYKIKGMTEDKALGILAEKIHTGIIEMPHLIVFSGKGLQLVWLIDNVFAKKGSGPERLFKAVQGCLLRNLAELNSDKVVMTPSNVYRLANTINSKNGEQVRTYALRSDRLKLGYFKENYLPIPKPNKKVPKPKKMISEGDKPVVLHDTRLWNEYSLNYQRVEDIFRILDYKQQNKEELIGIRQLLALVLRFHVLVYSNGDYELARSKVEEFWDRLEVRDDTTFEEIERRSRTAERYYKEWKGELPFTPTEKYPYPGLFYRNSRLVSKDVFDLSVECQIGLKTIKIRNKEYERIRKMLERRRKGDSSREEYLEEQNKQADATLNNILELFKKGYKGKQIAEKLEITQQWVSLKKKELKEKGLL